VDLPQAFSAPLPASAAIETMRAVIAHTFAPWYRAWFPMDTGTLPFWSLVFLWIFGVMIWFARPLLRARLLHFAFFLLMLLPGAAMWSFLFAIHDLIGISRLVGSFDPVQFMDSLDYALKISGILLAVFLLLTCISAFLFWRHLGTSTITYDANTEPGPDPDSFA
jgi:hypothetical protein